MSTRHGWTGTPAIRVAFQAPATPAVGVVVCPPFGQEGVVAYRTLRHLADELESRGIASVRYDPSGRGDSAPDDDPDAPVQSAETAATLLRDAGCTRIVFAGLASGVLVAAAAAARSVDADVVLWDPPASGRAWIRRQRALATMTIGSDRVVDGVESLLGVDLTPPAADAIAAIRMPSLPDRHVLVATRPGAVPPAGLGSVEHIEVAGTGELLDGTSMRARIPGGAVTAIADWVDAVTRSATAGAGNAPVLDDLVVPAACGEPVVVERIVSLGPDQLFGIETAPAEAHPGLPVVLLHNGAAEHRVGAGDYQVALARALARDGVRAVRFDRRGTGESGDVRADESSLLFTQEWIDDQDAVIAALGVSGGHLAIAGMCSGAWLAAHAAAAAPRLVVEISPNDYRRRPAAPGDDAEAARAVEDITAARQWLRDRWNRWVPAPVRLRLAWRRPTGSIAGHLRRIVQAGTRTVLVVSPLDAAIFEQLGGPDALARIGGDVEVVRVPDGDHSLFAPRMRATVIELVRHRVAAAFPAGVVEHRG